MLNFLQAEPVLSLVHDRQDPQAQINSTTSSPATFDISDGNIIIRSSDLIDFRVHKSVLAMMSPFFNDLLSLPQPSDSETVDGLPVVQLSEDSELLNGLVLMLYNVRTVIPSSYEKVLYLLANWSAAIANTLIQGVIPTCRMPKIRHGLNAIVYPH
jgi:BTB/POZ domain-containing protein